MLFRRPGRALQHRAPADIAVAGKNSETVQQTSTLAADAAGILERDYGIDAGEVLSMNVDTVETQEKKSEVKSDGADVILGKNGKTATWGSYTFPFSTSSVAGYGHSGREAFNYNGTPPTTSGTISSAWDIADKEVTVPETDKEGNTTYKKATESVVLYKNRSEVMEFLRNDAEWQNSSQNNDDGKFMEATYRTTIGGDTSLQGTENLDACGEAWWFFKLNKANTEGYAVCIDNHGHYGCGIFTRYWHQMYVVHYDYNHPRTQADMNAEKSREEDMAENEHLEVGVPKSPASGLPWGDSPVNIKILKKWRVSPMQVSPRYEIAVHEKDGKAAITVDPDELNSPYSYIGGEPYTYQGFYTGYEKGSDNTNVENSNSYKAGILNGNHTDAAKTYYRNKDDYDWAWPGATQNAVTYSFDLSDSIQAVDTTQAFSAYRWNGTYFANNSVDVVMQKAKSFGDIVYEPTWTDGALHMLINIDTKADGTMLGSDGGT